MSIQGSFREAINLSCAIAYCHNPYPRIEYFSLLTGLCRSYKDQRKTGKCSQCTSNGTVPANKASTYHSHRTTGSELVNRLAVHGLPVYAWRCGLWFTKDAGVTCSVVCNLTRWQIAFSPFPCCSYLWESFCSALCNLQDKVTNSIGPYTCRDQTRSDLPENLQGYHEHKDFKLVTPHSF